MHMNILTTLTANTRWLIDPTTQSVYRSPWDFYTSVDCSDWAPTTLCSQNCIITWKEYNIEFLPTCNRQQFRIPFTTMIVNYCKVKYSLANPFNPDQGWSILPWLELFPLSGSNWIKLWEKVIARISKELHTDSRASRDRIKQHRGILGQK